MTDTAITDPPVEQPRLDINLTPHEIVDRLGQPITFDGTNYRCPVCNYGLPTTQGMGPHIVGHWKEAGVTNGDAPSGKDRVGCPECSARKTRSTLTSHLVNVHKLDVRVATGIPRTHEFDLDAYLKPPVVAAKAAAPASAAARMTVDRAQHLIACPEESCGAVQRRKNMRKHLIGVHGYSDTAASQVIREAPATRHTKPVKSSASHRGRPAGSKNRPKTTQALVPVEQPINGRKSSIPDWKAIGSGDIALAVIQSQCNGDGVPLDLLPEIVAYVDITRVLVDKLPRCSRVSVTLASGWGLRAQAQSELSRTHNPGRSLVIGLVVVTQVLVAYTLIMQAAEITALWRVLRIRLEVPDGHQERDT